MAVARCSAVRMVVSMFSCSRLGSESRCPMLSTMGRHWYCSGQFGLEDCSGLFLYWVSQIMSQSLIHFTTIPLCAHTNTLAGGHAIQLLGRSLNPASRVMGRPSASLMDGTATSKIKSNIWWRHSLRHQVCADSVRTRLLSSMSAVSPAPAYQVSQTINAEVRSPVEGPADLRNRCPSGRLWRTIWCSSRNGWSTVSHSELAERNVGLDESMGMTQDRDGNCS